MTTLKWPVLVVCMAALLGLAVLVPPLVGNTQDENGLSGPGVVRELRVGQDKGRTRIVLEFSPETSTKDASYRWFTLPDPARVVVDFGNISFNAAPNLAKLPEGAMVSGLRAGRFRPDTVRMVVDLTKPGRVNVFGIPPRSGMGPRLVVDVVGVKRGQKPTDVPPPADVVEQGKAPVVNPRKVEDEPAPVVPPQVTREVGKTKRDHAIVVLDAGHGGVDPGACGKTLHLCEKGLTLDMVRRVRDKLRSDKIDVVLTRDSDEYIPLPDRPRVAQVRGADLFVSLHADLHPTDRSVRGATVYMVSEKASDREAARLAHSENSSDVMVGVALKDESREVQNILISLVQRDTLNNSVYLGRSVLDEVDKFTVVRKKTLLSAGFRVLKSPDVPSILVEMGYLSNRTEERNFTNAKYKDKLAEAIAKGIRAYIQKHVHY